MKMRMNRPERAGFSLREAQANAVNGLTQIGGNIFRDRRLRPGAHRAGEAVMGIVWTIIIGFIAGVVAKFVMPGSNEPAGFVLTTILGIIGAFVATYLGQSLGWYAPGQGAGLIGAIVGAIVVLLVWGMVSGRNRAV
jgi:uncharacterized membrane protein YeaQ/YmgE (transglycosylase-associated protein family)